MAVEMAEDDAKRIELTIRDEIDGDITETCVIYLGRGQLICAILEARRPLVNWYNVRSVNQHTSPHLNWNPRDSVLSSGVVARRCLPSVKPPGRGA